MLYDVAKPVSPMIQFIEVQDGVAIYHKINYLEDCDRFVVEEVLKCQRNLQPVLIGTISIQESNEICKKLASKGIRFQILGNGNKIIKQFKIV